jgi:hypothetical protein
MAAARQGLPVRFDRAPQRGAAFAITRASRRARTRSIGSRSRARGSSLIFDHRRRSPASPWPCSLPRARAQEVHRSSLTIPPPSLRAKDAALTFYEPVTLHHARSGAASTPSSTPPRASRRASVPPEPSCLPELTAAPRHLDHPVRGNQLSASTAANVLVSAFRCQRLPHAIFWTADDLAIEHRDYAVSKK